MVAQLNNRVLQLSVFHVLLFHLSGTVQRNIRYSIPEELEVGAFVGDVARDLGLEIKQLSQRRFRIASEKQTQHLAVNLRTGAIFIKEKIDREELCGHSFSCVLMLEAIIEGPLEIYRIEVEILDINDNAPLFQREEINKAISEVAPVGTIIPLPSAMDADAGINGVHSYQLNPSAHFSLKLQSDGEQSLIPELVLERPLDRERQTTHILTLSASDGGNPKKTGTTQIIITVLDVNDNAPVCKQSIYQITTPENVPKDSLIVQVTAEDLDEGLNGEVIYSFSDHTPDRVRELFSLDPASGEIRVIGAVDFEEANNYQILVQAENRGTGQIPVYCKVVLRISDVNDNWPEIITTSTFNTIPENIVANTAVSLIRVRDRDYENSPYVSCSIPGDIPFNLNGSFNNYFRLITRGNIDREKVPEYNVTITCTDSGSPPLSTKKLIRVQIADINDNAPQFTQPSFTVHVTENNVIGSSIGSVPAIDPDSNQNAQLSYSILDSLINGLPSSTFVSINPTSGALFSRRSFDYEQTKTFTFHVQVKDAGIPPLSSNATVKVVIIDQNDNAPVIISPLSAVDDSIPRSADSGYLVSKVTATDADSGRNAQLSYELRRPTDESLFTVAPKTGEIWTIRRFVHKDSLKQKILIVVKDKGTPSLSSTVTINVSVLDDLAENSSNESLFGTIGPWKTDVKQYLMILFGTTSFILFVAIVILGIKVHRSGNYSGSHCCVGDTSYFPRRRNSPHGVQKASANLQMPPSYREARDNENHPQDFIDEVTPNEAVSHLMLLKLHESAALTNNIKNGASVSAEHGKTSYTLNMDTTGFYEICSNRQWDMEQSSMEMYPSGQYNLGENEVEPDHRRFMEIHSHAL